MAGEFYGISSYHKTNEAWSNYNQADKNVQSTSVAKSGSSNAAIDNAEGNTGKTNSNGATMGRIDKDVKVTPWKPLNEKSPLIPTNKSGYGTVIGDVQLSDKAKDYYNKLKEKFHGMEFILVKSDMKKQVAANASAYGNSGKMVVLIDEEKLERMASDESFRKKYENIISSSQIKMQDARNTLASSGVNVKNFGMSVASDGTTSFFATVEKANDIQAKNLEKRQAAKKAAKAKEKKEAKKEEAKERLEKARENNKLKDDDKKYIEFKSDNLEDLINSLSKYAYDNSESSMLSKAESVLGSNIDFKG